MPRPLVSDLLTQRQWKIPESVLVVIHTAELDVLLLRRTATEAFWQSVTGSKDFDDEPLEQTACREVAEETGIVCSSAALGEVSPATRSGRITTRLSDWHLRNVYEIYPAWRKRYAPGVSHNTEHVFGLCLSGRVTPVLSPSEHDEWQWLPWKAAADRCFSPSNAEAILLLPEFAR